MTSNWNSWVGALDVAGTQIQCTSLTTPGSVPGSDEVRSIGSGAATVAQSTTSVSSHHCVSLGHPHKDSTTGLYDKARPRRLPPNTKPAPLT
jgi:hypothetical protein